MKPEILIVDDEPQILESLRRILSPQFTVTTACGGEEGIAQICGTKRFAVVLSDMRMPGYNGVAVLETARFQSPETVRIILSGFADYESAAAAVNRGAVDQMISKPVSRDNLLQVLTEAAELHWQRVTEKSFRNRLPADLGEMSAEMVKAFDRGEFTLVYQPQVHLGSFEVVGYEALMRWNSSRYGNVSPAVFIRIAELTGFVVPLTEWALDEVTRKLSGWLSDGMAPVRVAVNVCPLHLQSGKLYRTVEERLQETALPPELLEIEVTESAEIENPSEFIRQIDLLHDLGVGVSLDDFGSGFCSLSYVERFRITKLKLDKTLVDGLRRGENGAIILEAMVAMARKLGLKLVAEGVETEAQSHALTDLGCDIVQGYHFGKPMAVEEVPNFIYTPLERSGTTISDHAVLATIHGTGSEQRRVQT
jgi:EAL domain-containing protein (putative c-di-GMP-specific phosphodiesterase class I)/CheY-like chemotaxis protein